MNGRAGGTGGAGQGTGMALADTDSVRPEPNRSEREMLDAVLHVFRRSGRGNQGQILHAASDRNAELVGVDQARKRFRGLLPSRAYPKKIPIPGKEHTVQGSRAGEQDGVVCFCMQVVLSRRYRNIPSPQCIGDALRDMDIHVEPQAQETGDLSRRRRRSGESAAAAADCSASARLSAISESNAAWWS